MVLNDFCSIFFRPICSSSFLKIRLQPISLLSFPSTSFVRSKSLEYGIIPPLFEKKDFHIHVPEGATPKDGPSAGVAMVTSIVSSITKNPIDRKIAMTGEVTITGQVLQIGGLKEKLLAAHRAGIKKVVIPKDNPAPYEKYNHLPSYHLGLTNLTLSSNNSIVSS